MTNTQQKRKTYNLEDVYEEENVDDLEFAANFAFVTDIPNTVPPTQDMIRDKSIEKLDGPPPQEMNTDNSSNVLLEKNDTSDSEESDQGCSSTDDESDVDLSEELAQMENEDDDEPHDGVKKGSNRIVVPKTQNELDVYNCPVTELEKKLDIGLEVSDTLLFEPDPNIGVMRGHVREDRIRLAGSVKFHMVSDRTIVVESHPVSCESSVKSVMYPTGLGNKPLLLDEGNLLLLKVDKGNPILESVVHGVTLQDDEVCVIPLGKILEVFGPVSKPLYTLRLAQKKPPVGVQSTTSGRVQEVDPTTTSTPVESNGRHSETVEQHEDGTTCASMAKSVDGNENVDVDRDMSVVEKQSTQGDGSRLQEEVQSSPKIVDPWSECGILTNWLKASPKLEVYYYQDQVKIVDTQSIVKNSKKGCDASNIYDEEVTDDKEMYFSDDEEERAAKRGNKRQNKTKTHGSSHSNNRATSENDRYRYNHQQTTVPNPPMPHYTYHAANPPLAMTPHVQYQNYPFGRPPPLHPQYTWMHHGPSQGMYTNQHMSGSAAPPPPPPPPPPPRPHPQPYSSNIPPSQYNHNYPPAVSYYTNPYQGQQQNQEGNATDTNTTHHGDTVYYNYSGS